MYKMYCNILPDYIINGFNISATTKIRETRQNFQINIWNSLSKDT